MKNCETKNIILSEKNIFQKKNFQKYEKKNNNTKHIFYLPVNIEILPVSNQTVITELLFGSFISDVIPTKYIF